MDDREQVIEQVKRLVEADPLFIDTETTGFGDAEIVEIAVIDIAGNILFNNLVKPIRPIPDEVVGIHGITNEMVKDAPSFKEIFPELERILRNRVVIIYNVEFDKSMLVNSARVHEMQDCNFWWQSYPNTRLWYCAMQMYAVYYGDFNSYRSSYRWQRLGKAAMQCGIQLQDTHRALADAELTRQIVLHMAKEQQI